MTIKAKIAIDKAQENYKIVLEVLEINTEIIQKNNSVIGIKTLLDIIFITL